MKNSVKRLLNELTLRVELLESFIFRLDNLDYFFYLPDQTKKILGIIFSDISIYESYYTSANKTHFHNELQLDLSYRQELLQLHQNGSLLLQSLYRTGTIQPFFLFV